MISDREAQVVIPPRKNVKPWQDTKNCLLKRNELLWTAKSLDRSIWKNGQATIEEVWLK